MIVIVSSSTIRDHGYLARDPNLSKDHARDPTRDHARDPARDPSHHQLMRRRLTLPVQCSDNPSYQGEGEECPLAEQVAVSRQQRTRSLHLTHKQVRQSHADKDVDTFDPQSNLCTFARYKNAEISFAITMTLIMYHPRDSTMLIWPRNKIALHCSLTTASLQRTSVKFSHCSEKAHSTKRRP